MIGSYPITWLVTELLSVVLFLVCLFHAQRQEDHRFETLKLMMFVLGSAIFEHVGVLFTKTYSYDQHRIMMFGLIPLSILLIESCLVYTAMTLFQYLHMPKWTSLWVVGLLSTFMDFAIDPVYVNDTYLLGGTMSGQWNWVTSYSGNYFGIPFFNFTGWIYMCGYYALLLYFNEWLAGKRKSAWLHKYNPILSSLFLILPLMLTGRALVGSGSKVREIVLLVFACSFAIALMIGYRKRREPVDFRKDSIIIIVPAVLQGYNIVVMLVRGISPAYIPVTVTTIILCVYLGFLYNNRKRA